MPKMWLAALLAFAFQVPLSLPAEDQGAGAPGVDVETLEKDLRRAVSAGQVQAATALVTQLLGAGAAGADAVISSALTGASPAIDDAVVAMLRASKSPEIRARALAGLAAQKGSKVKTRIALVEVAAEYAASDPAALTALHSLLDDPSRPLVFAVLARLTALAKRESVEPLLAQLEAREKKVHDRVYADVLRALRKITGVELEAAVDWKNYWEAHKGNKSPPVKKATSVTAVRKPASFFSVEVASSRVLFIIDVSSSMLEEDPLTPPAETATAGKAGEEEKSTGTTVVVKKKSPPPKPVAPRGGSSKRVRINRVKDELVRVINSLTPGTRFGVMSFSHELAWWGEGTGGLKDANPANKANAVSWVKALEANGATRTDLALQSALQVPEIDTIYLLTDGAPKDENDKRLEIEPILARTRQQNRYLRMRIHTISFAQIRDTRMRTFVKELAHQNDGVCTMLP